jgi:hypothetical protein
MEKINSDKSSSGRPDLSAEDNGKKLINKTGNFPIVEGLVFTLDIVRVQLSHGEDKFRQIVQRPSGPFR